MYEHTTIRSAAGRLNLWLLTVILLALSPLAAFAQSSSLTTCNPRENRADYDGDGMTDIAIFRPGNGAWWIVKSSDNSYYSVTLGTSGDRPVPGDYDGDGMADVAVQLPGNGRWDILKSASGSSSVLFVNAEFPAPGGYLTPLY